MRSFALLIVLVLISVSTVFAGEGCNPSPHFLFGESAMHVFDSLAQENQKDEFTLGILAHNIAFKSKDDALTQIAIDYLDRASTDTASHLVEAYRWSATMIAIRDQASILKVARSIFSVVPLIGGSSPAEKARQAFQKITDALHRDPGNVIIRFLRATAAVESAEHLPDLLPYAWEDLTHLEADVDRADMIQKFFLHLTWGKYHYKEGLLALDKEDTRSPEAIRLFTLMQNDLARADRFACTENTRYELSIWQKRFDIAFIRAAREEE